MVKKLRVSLALQPVATALFANSPFTDGKLNGFLSARSEVWRDTDPARTGMLPFAFEPGMGFERYVDYALDVPMYFLKRGATYIDVAGASFRDLLDGRLKAAPGERATLSDWANHLSTIFPEVRLKRYLEMRGADAGPRPMLTALPALFAGLLYDPAALDSGPRAYQALERGGSGKTARGCAALRAQGADRRSAAARGRKGRAGAGPGGPCKAAASRFAGPRRNAFSRPPRCDRGGPDRGRTADRGVSARMGREASSRRSNTASIEHRSEARARTRQGSAARNCLFPRSFASFPAKFGDSRSRPDNARSNPEMDETPSDQSVQAIVAKGPRGASPAVSPCAEAKNLGSSLDGARWLGFRQSRMQVRR